MIAEVFRKRRAALARMLEGRTALLANRRECLRNIPLVAYPFRASSHFLYFAGQLPSGSILLLNSHEAVLFLDRAESMDRIWHGSPEEWNAVEERTGVDRVLPRDELFAYIERIGRHRVTSLPTLDAETNEELSGILGRPLSVFGADKLLAKVVVSLRLIHDDFGVGEINKACATTVRAHLVGLRNIELNITERDVKVIMEAECARRGMSMAYPSIVTTHGDVLHNRNVEGTLRSGDMLLVDLGAESLAGYASDVTRTWPVSGQFSSSQRDIYALVLEAQKAALNMVRPNLRYRDIHLSAARVIAQGLVDLRLLVGDPDSLVERGAHALFFPHGLGHLVGLDVHDVEDLGDLAGYAPGRSRSKQFGLNYLRLDRDLQAGMVVTIEPGIYFIEPLLNEFTKLEEYRDCVQLDRLSMFKDVRGIRIEDTVLVTKAGAEVLTADLPKEIGDIETNMAR